MEAHPIISVTLWYIQYPHIMIRYIVLFALTFSLTSAFSQDLKYARAMDSTLCSPEFGGRGYVDNGEHIAAKFVRNQFKSFGLQSFTKNYFQPFSFAINTIQNDNGLSIDGKKLKGGVDYLISASAQTTKGTFELVYLPDSIFEDKKAIETFFKQDLSDKFILTEFRFKELKRLEKIPAKGMVYLNDKKMFWTVSNARTPHSFVIVDVMDSTVSKNSKTITLDFTSKYYKQYKTQNVAGFVKGKKYPDSFIVITSHYDHLGKMGHEVYFPGANDNASGTSMLLNLAKYFSKPENQPDFSIAFITFSGEEVGLMGSTYCAEHPLFPLTQIRFLVNLDMVGTGSKGITVVNATTYPKEFALMQKINEDKTLLKRVKSRGESCNSDHCPFYKKGVPSFFIYTMGDEYTEYHSVTDRYPDIPFTKYNNVFTLVAEFIKSF